MLLWCSWHGDYVSVINLIVSTNRLILYLWPHALLSIGLISDTERKKYEPIIDENVISSRILLDAFISMAVSNTVIIIIETELGEYLLFRYSSKSQHEKCQTCTRQTTRDFILNTLESCLLDWSVQLMLWIHSKHLRRYTIQYQAYYTNHASFLLFFVFQEFRMHSHFISC